MIRVQDLTKRFGPTVSVDGISFEIARGEVVGFLGPNGAGKTTTIRVLTGYHPASSGTAEVAGFDVDKQSLEVRRNIGYLPQEVPIYPDLRVVEYLRYRAALKGVPRRERKRSVERAIDKAGIANVARRLVGHVSHGYRQRVGLADALVANPPILILDEPTSGLDPNQRRRVKQVVRDLASEHTVLFSSHILGEVQDVSSRIIVIHRGQVKADGSPDQLVAASTQARLCVRARTTPELLREIVTALPGVVTISLVAESLVAESLAAESFGDGAALQVAVEAGQNPSIELGDRLLHANVAVIELKLELPKLEEYFYAVTDGSDFDRDGENAAATSVAAEGARTSASHPEDSQ